VHAFFFSVGHHTAEAWKWFWCQPALIRGVVIFLVSVAVWGYIDLCDRSDRKKRGCSN
jgi:hypothetical protein